ncbi:glycerol-3-phosphate dehydrogenase [Nitrosomonas sp. Nm51]|uniref:glycerol-3-phosphate dehydrogenase/oxidase n=1 Tax=Nitrosomonas sp. Nm51 TaxID=133720 RepID=UPI0008C0BC88|nr:glycerol-3-phosphate dehydrogenase/oxidase [Nitrosomonas sp. Nm51]SER62180.1 glycerol-3-phosphate dehydrogenase [Nitrosomonas sp. Nm51]
MNRNSEQLSGQTFDLLVCGGGIYGAWTAYDAALRGLKVALIDQNDWGSATSSASSKLVHGGLRYLEQFEFGLVRKTLTEREMLMKIAPHRVWPLRFGVPVYAHSRIGLLRLKLGLMTYDFLAAGQKTAKRHRYFNSQGFSERFPFLNDQTLKGGFTYADAQTDDARLVLELVQGAIDAGAACVNYCKLTGLLENSQRATGANIRDELADKTHQIQARQIVNTSGPWIAADTRRPDDCLLTRGIHLIMPNLDLKEALLLTARSDGRVFFMIPWYGLTLLGTTDTPYHGSLDCIEVDATEIDYLLNAVNDYLCESWSRSDIIGCFAGVRVLKQEAAASSGASPSSVSRDWVLKTASNGVHYSIGGKLTSARQDAARIVDRVCEELNIDANCATLNRMLPWSPQDTEKSAAPMNGFALWSEAVHARAVQLGVDANSALWLIRRHGCKAPDILQSIEDQPALAARIVPALPLTEADLMHCAAGEMVMHLDDLLRRRLPLLILAKLTEADLRRIGDKVSAVLNWNESRIQEEIARCQVRQQAKP